MSGTTLRRLDETLWTFNHRSGVEVRIQTPGLSSRTSDSKLARFVMQKLEGHANLDEAIKQVYTPDATEADGNLQKAWKIQDITQDWFYYRQNTSSYSAVRRMYSLYFTVFNFPINRMRVLQLSASGVISRTMAGLRSWGRWLIRSKELPQGADIASKTLPQDWIRYSVSDGLFKDPFTELATQALSQDETPFVSEDASAGSYQFVLDGEKLSLEPISKKSNPEHVRAAVNAYCRFLSRTFGWRILDRDPERRGKQIEDYPSLFEAQNNDEFQGYMTATLEIDLLAMIKEGKPLMPDHVYKCNIAANNIEMPLVDSFFQRLCRLYRQIKNFQGDISLNSPQGFCDFLSEHGCLSLFSARELRGLFQFLKERGLHELKAVDLLAYLKELTVAPVEEAPDDKMLLLPPAALGLLSEIEFTPNDQQVDYIRDISPQNFQNLMRMLYIDSNAPEPNSPERFFTGRKITHLAICGYKTMGNRSVYDPCRNLAELLHLFPNLQKRDEIAKIELLAHVVAKKDLCSHYPYKKDPTKEERRVSRVIPFGENCWYYVDGMLNDGGGDFNYVLIPASNGYSGSNEALLAGYKTLPLIKLYRSTASDGEAESSLDTVLADTNPDKVGSLDFTKGDEYEVAYFDRCTIPVWFGYLLIGEKEKAGEVYEGTPLNPKAADPLEGKLNQREINDRIVIREKNLRECFAEQLFLYRKKQGNEQEIRAEANRMLDEFLEGEKGARERLFKSPHGLEWDRPKIAQDIYFVGHSLGGALAQSGLVHFGAEFWRIPLYRCNYKCFAFDPPGVTSHESDMFLKFGNDHAALLMQFGQKWEVRYQFEYEDIVPKGGSIHLGATQDTMRSWLKVNGYRYKALETAEDLAVTTMPTHGRRFCLATAERDYEVVPINTKDLSSLKSAWWLNANLRAIFGYKWPSPRLTDTVGRRGPIGGLAFGYYWLSKQASLIYRSRKYQVDKDGVMYCTSNGYQAPIFEPSPALAPNI